MKKVYCDECKMVYRERKGLYRERRCRHGSYLASFFYGKELVSELCEDKNRYNDCKYFEPKWWVRVWWFLRGLFK